VSRYTRCAAPNGLLAPEISVASLQLIHRLHPTATLSLPTEEALEARLTGHTPNTETLRSLPGSLTPQEVLKVAVLGENVGECLVHDLIGGGMEKGGVLVDLLGGVLVETDRGGYLVGLNNLKQWHLTLLLMCDHELISKVNLCLCSRQISTA